MGERASRPNKCEKGDEYRDMHHVFTKRFFPPQKTENKKEYAENTRDESGFVSWTCENKARYTENEVGKPEDNRSGRHTLFVDGKYFWHRKKIPFYADSKPTSLDME